MIRRMTNSHDFKEADVVFLDEPNIFPNHNIKTITASALNRSPESRNQVSTMSNQHALNTDFTRSFMGMMVTREQMEMETDKLKNKYPSLKDKQNIRQLKILVTRENKRLMVDYFREKGVRLRF